MLLFEEVQKLNQKNTERSEACYNLAKDFQKSEDRLLTLKHNHIVDEAQTPSPEQEKYREEKKEEPIEAKKEENKETEPKLVEVQNETQQLVEEESKEMPPVTTDQEIKDTEEQTPIEDPLESDITDTQTPYPPDSSLQRCVFPSQTISNLF